MENISLIRKIAWSFHHTTGLEWDDLFQEAALAYCEALKNYDPKRGIKITTYMWWCISSDLKNYLKKQEKQNGHICSIEDVDVDRPVNTTPIFESLSKEATEIANMVLSSPKIFDNLPPELAKRNIARVLINRKGWSWRRVWVGIRDLKLAFS